MSKELKPCPFCGSTDLYVVQARIEEYHSVAPEISCKKCRYTIKLKELAIAVDESPETNADWWDRGTAKKWNTRPAEDALQAEVERLKEERENAFMIFRQLDWLYSEENENARMWELKIGGLSPSEWMCDIVRKAREIIGNIHEEQSK